jgi:hypothetical protein
MPCGRVQSPARPDVRGVERHQRQHDYERDGARHSPEDCPHDAAQHERHDDPTTLKELFTAAYFAFLLHDGRVA